MHTTYGQFCPVALGAEIIAERWTPLIVRELLNGSHRFCDLQRGLPGISRNLLTQRLGQLTRAGVIERRGSDHAAGYRLTEAEPPSRRSLTRSANGATAGQRRTCAASISIRPC